MTRPGLLAKSPRDGSFVTLQDHLLDTEKCAARIFNMEGRWGRAWLRFFKIPCTSADKFLLNLRAAALLHDLGKANEDFQHMVTGKLKTAQTLRHEHISALLLNMSGIAEWFSQNEMLDHIIVTAAVLSHHAKATSEPSHRYCWGQPHSNKPVTRLHLTDTQVLTVFERLTTLAGLTPFPVEQLPQQYLLGGNDVWEKARERGMASDDDITDWPDDYPKRHRLLLAVKAGLMVADAASSGLVRVGAALKDWIDERIVDFEDIQPDMVEEAILQPWKERQQKRKPNKTIRLHNFQRDIIHAGSRVLLIKSCGGGKSIAAWRWAKQQTSQRSIGRILFLYPTRGTATEGFKDYVSFAKADAALLSGVARYELYDMAENGEPEERARARRHQLSEVEERLFALGLWRHRYFSATVDQILSFMEHDHKAICLLPVLADSAVIIDEVHSFDRRMFARLLDFLRTFDVPVLCMTATLSTARKKDLIANGLVQFPSPGSETSEDTRLEHHPRYAIQNLPQQGEAGTPLNELIERAIQHYRRGDRVLWVVNTVQRCQEIYRGLRTDDRIAPEELFIYHSRYRTKERRNIHSRVVEAFQQQDSPAIAVTTQVCEMSLDLDADALFTEKAPPSSLVQRFGRTNRHLRRGEDFRAALYVYSPPSHHPYDEQDLTEASIFLNKIHDQFNISQHELAEGMEASVQQERASQKTSSGFLRGDYFALRGDFREDDGYNCTAILESDIQTVLERKRRKEEYKQYLLHAPVRVVETTDRQIPDLPRYIRILRDDLYCRVLGLLREERR